MKAIVDTNVAMVANQAAPQATADCVARCARRLRTIQREGVIVLDDDWRILREYQAHLSTTVQGVGNEFYAWVVRNLTNPRFCEQVHLTPELPGQVEHDFERYPQDAALADFDPSDRKFVAVAMEHPEHPPILNAADSDWWYHREALARHGVQVEFLCPDAPFMQ